MPTPWLLPLLAAPALAAVFAVAWRVQVRTRNAGWVDVLWAASLGVLGVAYAAGANGWIGRRLLVALLAGAWSVRLAVHLGQRLAGEPEDGRYRTLREEWGLDHGSRMLGFFLAQATLALLLSLAFLVPMTDASAGFRGTDLFALGLYLLSLTGESLSDAQLSAWKSNPANRGKTCRAGLWRYSRHPNYFFEWLHWLVYPLLALGAPGGWLVFAAPALMLFLVLRVTGIPPTEAQSVRSRGEDYRRYQRTTNAFFPGPPRPDVSPASASEELSR